MEQEHMNIIINTINYSGSIADGPGIRTVLFLQGCEQKCEGCHNPTSWDIAQGRSIPIEGLVRELRDNAPNRKLTISGGEPLLQYPAVLKLVQSLPEFDIALYTGLELHDVPDEILQYLKYIKVGRYIQEKRCTTVPYIGSTNQKFIEMREGRK